MSRRESTLLGLAILGIVLLAAAAQWDNFALAILGFGAIILVFGIGMLTMRP